MTRPTGRLAGDRTKPASAVRMVLSPRGRVVLETEPDPTADVALEPNLVRSLASAFEGGDGHGLLHLGAVRVPPELPPSLTFWREIGHLFVTRLCATVDLESQRGAARVPPPLDELETLTRAAPAMVGGEYLSPGKLARIWERIEEAFRAEIEGFDGEVQAFFTRLDPAWNVVGRVCFHLAENKRSERTPFAFLATYAARLSRGDRVQHLPLARALAEFGGARRREALLALLSPVQKAAARSPFLKELVDRKAIFRPLAWTPAEAYRFLQDVPRFEQSGVVVRVPDWWKRRSRSRPTVTVTVGAKSAPTLGADTMLDFRVDCALDGEPLSASEWRELSQATDGLALIKGKWVEIDREKLDQALSHWRQVQERAGRDGLSFVEGMRLLAGVTLEEGRDGIPEQDRDWVSVVADRRLRDILAELRRPEELAQAHPGELLQARLRPYQELGVRWLWFLHRLGLGTCLADDMGLGKTIQVLALLLLIKQQAGKHRGARPTSLLVAPASLLANWRSEIGRFAPSLETLVAHPSEIPSAQLARISTKRLRGHDLVMTSYGTLVRQSWPSSFSWHLVVLDEAQAIKNPGAKQTRCVKALKSRSRVVLTGTPVENRLSDLWSLFDFTCPGLLGTARQFSAYAKRLASGAGSYGPLRELVRPYIMRRLKTDKDVIADLPDKTEVLTYCGLSGKQAALYQKSVDALARRLDEVAGVERRGVVLAFLLRLKQICNHPSQWLEDGGYDPADSGKFARLTALCEEIAARQDKVLVFTQFRQIIDPLAELLSGVFRREGLVLHGQTAVGKRKGLVDAFDRDGGPPFFVLSLRAGGTGLNLTAASHVIHFDRWWNPAVEDQASDRAYRIGQRRNVLVHKFICRGTVEERIEELISSKRKLSAEILEAGAEAPLTELSDEELIDLVSLDIHSALQE